jgi:acyl-CoA thioester hydrolase
MREFHFYHEIEVRYGDLDPQGHVNNAKFFTYLEQTRISYVIHLGLWEGKSFSDIGFILAEVRLTFRAPILFGQKVQVGARVTRLGNKSLTMEYRMEDAQSGETFATGDAVLVTYDYHSQTTIPIPERWRAVIEEFEGLAAQ